jgi:hypothetical protein
MQMFEINYIPAYSLKAQIQRKEKTFYIPVKQFLCHLPLDQPLISELFSEPCWAMRALIIFLTAPVHSSCGWRNIVKVSELRPPLPVQRGDGAILSSQPLLKPAKGTGSLPVKGRSIV